MPGYERSQEALEDWRDIIEYTIHKYGASQAEKYSDALISCIESMAQNKGYLKEIRVKGRTVRVKHCQKHYIFGLVRKDRPMIIIAFLHERMDLMTRLKGRL